MVTSLVQTPPASLASFGMPGCNSYLSLDAVVLGLGGSTITFTVTFPANPAFEAVPFVQQAVVVNAGVNAIGLIVSNPARSVTGLR